MASNNNTTTITRHGSPFCMKNDSVSIHGKEEDKNNFDVDEDNKSNRFALSTFRSLIQMKTQNYQLTSFLSLSTIDSWYKW